MCRTIGGSSERQLLRRGRVVVDQAVFACGYNLLRNADDELEAADVMQCDLWGVVAIAAEEGGGRRLLGPSVDGNTDANVRRPAERDEVPSVASSEISVAANSRAYSSAVSETFTSSGRR